MFKKLFNLLSGGNKCGTKSAPSETKLHYGDTVEVVKGFYKGSRGTVWDYVDGDYYVVLGNNEYKTRYDKWFKEDFLEKLNAN